MFVCPYVSMRSFPNLHVLQVDTSRSQTSDISGNKEAPLAQNWFATRRSSVGTAAVLVRLRRLRVLSLFLHGISCR